MLRMYVLIKNVIKLILLYVLMNNVSVHNFIHNVDK